MGYPGGAVVKNLPAVQEPQETHVQSLGWEDPLEQKMATHYSTLAWKIPWTEEPGGLQSMVSQRVRHEHARTSLILRKALPRVTKVARVLEFQL